MKIDKNDPVNKIYRIGKIIRTFTDEDFKEIEEIINQQESYYNPLKMGTVNKQRQLAEHNKKTLNCIRELKDLIGRE